MVNQPRGLPRNCVRCGERYQPYGRSQKLCLPCVKKSKANRKGKKYPQNKGMREYNGK